jgi:elongation factor G
MAKYEPGYLRNIAVVGHGGTGKTSLCESLLYVAGKTDRLGRVDEGTSNLDFEPEEQKRHISIGSAINFVEWDKHKINIVDTPGDSDFAYDTKNCLRVVDGAVIVVDAIGGVEFQTETVWKYADEFKLPRIVFINRMDRERADFYHAIETIKIRLGKKVTPLHLPIGAESNFAGLIDLISMRSLTFDEATGKYKAGDIPADLEGKANECREAMVEDIAESDEKLMDKYLETGELSTEEIWNGLRKAVISGALIPALCGSAIKNIGATSLLDMIVACLPSPTDRGVVIGKKPNTKEDVQRLPAESEAFSAFVFKTIADPYAGKLTIFRVYSGSVSSDASFVNTVRKINERFGNIFFLEGKSQKPIDSPLVPGDIAAVA